MDRENTKKKGRNSWMAVLIAALVFVVLIAAFAQRADESQTITAIGDPEAEAPEITAKSAAIYSLQLDRQVYGKNADEHMDPYSITKILTCYLALENLDPDDEVTISASAARTYENGTSILLKEGEKISVQDLIYGALLASGNDAAYALGEAVSGSEEDFAELMNKTVGKWGCKDTHFVNANGWKNAQHYTTAHDMAIIAKNCFANENLLKMSVKEKYTIPETNLTQPRDLKNYFLSATTDVKGIKGGKTGRWSDDDCSIVLKFKRKGLIAAIVIMGDTNKARKSDVKKLMKFANKVTPGFIVSDEGDVVAETRVKHGRETKVDLTVDGITYAYPAKNRTRDIKVETQINKLEAPLKAGAEAGKYIVYVDGEQIAEHTLLVAKDVETGWFPSYWYISNKATLIILAVIAVLAGLILLLREYSRRQRAKRRAAFKERQRLRQERMAAMLAEEESQEQAPEQDSAEQPDESGEQPPENTDPEPEDSY